jgi:hypothetical protein
VIDADGVCVSCATTLTTTTMTTTCDDGVVMLIVNATCCDDDQPSREQQQQQQQQQQQPVWPSWLMPDDRSRSLVLTLMTLMLTTLNLPMTTMHRRDHDQTRSGPNQMTVKVETVGCDRADWVVLGCLCPRGDARLMPTWTWIVIASKWLWWMAATVVLCEENTVKQAKLKNKLFFFFLVFIFLCGQIIMESPIGLVTPLKMFSTLWRAWSWKKRLEKTKSKLFDFWIFKRRFEVEKHVWDDGIDGG